MSDPSSWFPDLRPADERTALEQFLDQYRHIVASKLADLDQAQASARALEATDLTVGGIVKHLAWAEDRWFQGKLLGFGAAGALGLRSPANLRWILVHMIDETARHAGHLDLLRDSIDRGASS
ncbi:MAG: DUF664 domain-containing protein [Candidatus Limnocylindrales bacterium]